MCRHACPACGTVVHSRRASGRIRVKHQRPDGLPCECESWQAHKRESSVEGCDLETHETGAGQWWGMGPGRRGNRSEQGQGWGMGGLGDGPLGLLRGGA